MASVGASIGSGIHHTTELKTMKFKEAMKQDEEGWLQAVEKEYQRMVKKSVWSPIERDNIHSNSKVLTSTWVMKKKEERRGVVNPRRKKEKKKKRTRNIISCGGGCRWWWWWL